MGQTERITPAPVEQPFHLGDRIRKAREHAGYDRQTFAELVGIHRDTLAKYEETGRAKRSALISVAWNSRVRLEWLETGALPWLEGDNVRSRPLSESKQTTLAPVTRIQDRRNVA